MDTGIRKFGRNERGSNLVETAIGLGLLVLLLVGIGDLGRVFNNYIIITNAAREGARRASRFPDPAAEVYVKQATMDEARNSGITLSESNITVARDPRGPTPGTPITVTVDYQMPALIPGVLGLSEVPMRSTSEMVVYGIQ